LRGASIGGREVSEYTFLLTLRGNRPTDKELADLNAATRGDATFGFQNGRLFADFDREAESLPQALTTAIVEIESTVPTLRVVKVEGDESVLVSSADIARRVGLSREEIRLLANGERGSGDFPSPTALIGGNRRIWRWADVAAWFAARDEAEQRPRASDVATRNFVRVVNALLETRESARLASETERRLLQGLIQYQTWLTSAQLEVTMTVDPVRNTCATQRSSVVPDGQAPRLALNTRSRRPRLSIDDRVTSFAA